ncbi:MAG: hypothetical protein JWQ87_5256 [Candidatus Sulfotelmatobacter sp.]|nr:hypothetical protein [Candidatus Sulfotelmatobacter sp.]
MFCYSARQKRSDTGERAPSQQQTQYSAHIRWSDVSRKWHQRSNKERRTDKLLHLSDEVEFRNLFVEFTWWKEDAPTARPLVVKRHRERRNGFHFENIAVGPYCAIVKPGVPQLRCYVGCSDQVLDIINRRMPTPSRNSRVSFDVKVGSDGFVIVSAQSTEVISQRLSRDEREPFLVRF